MKASDVIREVLLHEGMGDVSAHIYDGSVAEIIEAALRDAGFLNEWVKVSERLPNSSDYIAVKCEEDIQMCWYDSDEGFYKTLTEDYEGSPQYEKHYSEVTHWQQIQPPSEE